MKWRKGPRPWSIRLFALAFLFAAMWRLLDHLLNPLSAWFLYSERFPQIEWTGDLVIVASSAEFTIALIPIVWIFGLGSRVARWIVTLFGIYKLLPYSWSPDLILFSIESNPLLLVPFLATVLALVMLYVPASGRWFDRSREVAPETFA